MHASDHRFPGVQTTGYGCGISSLVIPRDPGFVCSKSTFCGEPVSIVASRSEAGALQQYLLTDRDMSILFSPQRPVGMVLRTRNRCQRRVI